VEPEALSFCFEALVKDSPLETLRLEIERCPRRQRCAECGNVFAVADFDWNCPACGSAQTTPAGGDELEIAYLEVEER
jgi:hydrogenase nickel incorporation protein HypA/HybF